MFRYNTTIQPPAAFVQVTLLDPITGLSVQKPGKLDTGASITVLPESVVTTLRLKAVSEGFVTGFNGKGTLRPLYYVAMEIAGYNIPLVEVTSAQRSDFLLGRDVLNQFILTLDGKALTFYLHDP
ncbi:MAG: retroviral-like aspartic protease family protein [Anaerolineae bacterium]